MLTREQMKKAIEDGNTVSFGGRLIRDVRDLPDEEAVAVSSVEKRAALERLEQDHTEMTRRISVLRDDIVLTERNEAEAARVDAEQRKLAAQRPNTAPVQQGAPLNPVTTGQPPVPKNEGKNEGNGEDDVNPLDEKFAGRKLSVYKKKLDDAQPADDTEAKKILSEMEGVGDATAQKIIDALDEVDE